MVHGETGLNLPQTPSRRAVAQRVLKRVGFERIANHGPGEWSPLVWFAGAVIALEVIVLQGYNLLIGRTIRFLVNPLSILEVAVVLGAAISVQLLHTRYDRAVERSHLSERADDPAVFEYFVPDWIVVAVILAGLAFTLVNAVLVLTIPYLHEIGGPARVIRFVVVIPFGYVPIVATGVATYLSAEVLVPRRLEQSGIGLDYLDPENLGGMRPFGELVKFAYYVVMLGLITYAITTYGPHLIEGVLGYEELQDPGRFTNVAFTAVWALAVGAMVYGICVLHRLRAREKQKDLHRLERRAREEFGRSWDIEEIDAADPPDE